MAHIVIDARELRTSTGRYIERLIHYLQQIDSANKYTILLLPKDYPTWQPSAKNFVKKECSYKEFTFGEQLGYTWFLYKLQADLVHFGMVQQPLLYFKKSVTTIHDLTTIRFRNPSKPALVFWLKSPPYRLVIWWAAHKNRTIITPTNYVKDDVANFAHINKDKIVVTYESADEIAGKATPITPLAGKDFIMYVGRPQPHKNLSRLIEAYALMRNKYPSLKLVIAGKKDKLHLNHFATAKKLGVADGLVFTGYITDSQLKWLYLHTQAYVFASLSEGFGLPPLEAMIHGAPVICSNATCLPEVYGNAPEYFVPTDVHAIANAIDKVLSNATLRQQMIQKGHRQVNKYSWERMAKQTLEIYEEALTPK